VECCLLGADLVTQLHERHLSLVPGQGGARDRVVGGVRSHSHMVDQSSQP
jgi:hypothetical protein